MERNMCELKHAAWNVKRRILQMANRCKKNVHLGGVLSISDLLTVLYKSILHYDFSDPRWEERDRFILSKGHCALALYAVLAECGVLTEEDADLFQKNGSALSAHPVMNLSFGIESSNGSLGQGISMAVGIAKTAKILNRKYQVYTLIGNGECNEGSVWEAAMLAAQWSLDNLTVILDDNGLQSDGASRDIVRMDSMAEKWKSFGFDVAEINGHDLNEICQAYECRGSERPRVIIAHTVKGHGVSFMENQNEWHHSRLTDELYEKAYQELEEERNA